MANVGSLSSERSGAGEDWATGVGKDGPDLAAGDVSWVEFPVEEQL